MSGKLSVSNLPLHGGKAPPWLLKRMVPLADSIMRIMVAEFGTREVVRRLSDPYWFQALSCVLGFDWHSSGTTTVTTGVLKQVLTPDIGLGVCGGKGSKARATPDDIIRVGEWFNLHSSIIEGAVRASRLTAKIDTSALQDTFDIYHHVIVLDEGGEWCVIQQGMNPHLRMARRYQWYCGDVEDGYLNDPHRAIISDMNVELALNMASKESEEARKTALDLVSSSLSGLRQDYNALVSHIQHLRGQHTLHDFDGTVGYKSVQRDVGKVLDMPWRLNWKAIRSLYEFSPKNYEDMLLVRGVGPATVRALALISELIYGNEASWRDPVKYTFTVGGKDGVPYPVNRRVMDDTIEVLKNAIGEAEVKTSDKLAALKRLRSVIPEEIRESVPLF